jgi:hypothetical protein
MSRFACSDGLKLNPTTASASREQPEAWIRSPFRAAPAPRIAVNVSCAPGVVHDPGHGVGAVLQRYAYRPRASAADVVPCAIERVDDPPTVTGAAAVRASLGEHPVGGERGAQAIGDEALAGEVDVGDEIVRVRFPAADRQPGPLSHLLPAGLAGEVFGGCERCRKSGAHHVATFPHRAVASHARCTATDLGMLAVAVVRS